MPAPKPVPSIEGLRMHRMAPSPDRANRRSETPKGFARAVFEANVWLKIFQCRQEEENTSIIL